MEPVLLPPQLSREFLLFHGCCPLEIDADGHLIVATTREQDQETMDDLAFAFGAEPVLRPVEAGHLPVLVERLATRSATASGVREDSAGPSLFESDVRELATQPPVVRYVNLLLGDGLATRASDIHLESHADGLRVRFRVDGVLVPALGPPPGLEVAVVSRLKLLAGLDIAEKRAPQDGRFKTRIDDRTYVDLRVASSPTVHGESVVLRILDRAGGRVELEGLGMAEPLRETLVSIVRRATGLVLTTGPTGSGKTTTLYGLLGQRDPTSEKIITIEDPVEYSLSGVNQIPVNTEAGVTFASALRSVLRQDPDVIMVGEIRDAETAGLAVQAALTGHLVLASLHTNDAEGALPRLMDLGVPDFLLKATLTGVLAQRLVRRCCDLCAGSPSASGCDACRGTSYRGRAGLFDLIVSDGRGGWSRGSWGSGADGSGLERDGFDKVRLGVTTMQEVLRVLS